uniref:RNase H type-1 domain-containing protein n=1 Tax=Chenopodium quinoa TaxID=63459 RepID=A0A803MMT4_CHEQI
MKTRQNIEVGAGAVIRASDGGWLGGCSWKVTARTSAEVELLAIKGGMLVAINARYKKVTMETDAQSLKGILEDLKKSGTHEFAAILKDIGELLKGACKFEFNYIRREANEVAHHLAKLAQQLEGHIMTHDSVPPCARLAYEKNLKDSNDSS